MWCGAKDMDVGVFIVAHPTKQILNPMKGEVREPTLYDVDGSAHWYNNVEYGLSVWRPDPVDTAVKIESLKVRYTQKPDGEKIMRGGAWLRFDGELGGYRQTVPQLRPQSDLKSNTDGHWGHRKQQDIDQILDRARGLAN